MDNKLSEADLENIIEEVDEDGSGTLDFDGKKSASNSAIYIRCGIKAAVAKIR